MNGYILRIAPGEIDRIQEALDSNQIIIGWSKALGLLDKSLSWQQFREIIYQTYYFNDPDYKNAGRAAGNIWRFIREMEIGDLVIVPYGNQCYFAQISGDALHMIEKLDEDTAYRRNVQWLNSKESIPRKYAKAALQSRMKIRQTCAYASDLLDDINDLLEVGSAGTKPTFGNDLRKKLLIETLNEIRSGRIDSFGFEKLIATILLSLGSNKVDIIPRNLDKGADIIANYTIAETTNIRLAVQAKHYQSSPPVGKEALEQLLTGIEAEGASLGWLVTSGSFSDEVFSLKEELETSQALRIELIDGEQLASLIIESGLKKIIGND